MKRITIVKLLLLTLISLSVSYFSSASAQHKNTGWKAGTARMNITPEQPMWLAGYGGRDHESEGTLVDIWAKALALEDANGKKAILITTDLLGMPQEISNRIRAQLHTRFGLSKAQIILNSSHTHSAPVLGDALPDIYPMNAAQWEKVNKYSKKLEEQIVALAAKALKDLEPAKVFTQNGVTRFQVNRRNNKEATLTQQTELKGPNEYSVPVIKVVNSKGKLKAIAFGYACHPTVLSLYKWSGDYPGYAQIELEKAHPGVTALFFQGAGADQNPLPRRTIALAKQYGHELFAAVERVMEEDDMKEVSPTLTTAYKEIDLKLAPVQPKEELEKMAKNSPGYEKRWAERVLGKVNRGESFPTSYPYPLQVWQLGEQPIMTLGGELVIQYAIDLKRIFGQNLFVMGYSNDVMTYIPSELILKEGGYEGALAHMVYGLPSKWAPGVEKTILDEMTKLAEEAGLKKVSK
ncbi:MAG TPA: neutral/alkaline non-lysosomal ceramidase N-terminal domain-containing protein [Sphingobacteriaceae bacterium]